MSNKITPEILYPLYDIFFDTVINQKLGPTLTTRFLYLSSLIVRDTYLFARGEKNLDFKTRPGGVLDKDIFLTLVYKALIYQYNLLRYDIAPLNQYYLSVVPNETNLNESQREYFTALTNFLLQRDEDGWKEANREFDFPNKSLFIDYENGQSQDLDSYLSPQNYYSWTPIKIQGKVQTYLTPFWGEVKDVTRSRELRDRYRLIAKVNFPSNSDRDDEITELVGIYKSLSVEQKMIAEYFAGGRGTVSPPGIWNIFAYYASQSVRMGAGDLTKFFYILNASLFQSGIVAWEIKKAYLQSRPIQDIRRLYKNRNVTNYDGKAVLGKIWKPFQETNFVTPPFPDYISGHSTFSSSAARVFSYLLRGRNPANLDLKSFSRKHLTYICPMFKESPEEQNDIQSIYLNKYCSSIVPNYPYCAIKLTYNDWQSIANASGISRLYGGIHTQAANGAGLAIGDRIAKDILKLLV